MMESEDWGKRILALFFLFFIFTIGIKSQPWKLISDTAFINSEEGTALVNAKEHYVDSFYLKSKFIDLNGKIARGLNIQGYYSDMGLYITDDNYIVSSYKKTSDDYEYEQIVNLKKYLDRKQVNFLYVNAPIRYTEDDFMKEEFGIASYNNQNADLLLKRISEAGVKCIDLREKVLVDELDIWSMFFRTDHHWTPESGLWAAGNVAEALNQKCGYNIDMSIYQAENFVYKDYKNCWLGEQGHKIGQSYLGLDNFTTVKPGYETDFIVTKVDGTYDGTFDVMVDEAYYNQGVDPYEAASWYYSYMNNLHMSSVHNNNVDFGNILLVADSYSKVVVPYLSLGVSDVTTLIMRNFEGDLKEFIDEKEFDTVVILYAQSMIGAHDDPTSANYDMFTFE